MPRKKKLPVPDSDSCVIYARFSSDRQRDESIEDQVRVCTRWAAENGLVVTKVYADRAISGTSDERPQFLKMVDDARRGSFCAVVVYKLDRFSRNRYDSAIYKKRLADCGVRVESAMESIPDTPEGVLLESMISGINDYYVKNLAQNVRRGMAGNAERCLTNGNVVFGYRTGADGRYEVDESQARYVRQAFDMVDAGKTRTQVMDWLNSEGVPNSRGNRWNYGNIQRLLTNERYLGVYEWGDVRVEGGMPAIVTREQFERVRGYSPKGKPRQNSFPLSGKLVDYETGTPYRGTSGTSCSGKQYLYYSVPDGMGHERRYAKDVVECSVVDVLERAFREPEYAESMAGAVVEALGRELGVESVERMHKELADIERREQNLIKAVEEGLDVSMVRGRAKELRERRARLQDDIRASESLPTVDEVAEWVSTSLCRRSGHDIMKNAVQRCAIDGDGKLYVEVPWRLSSDKLNSASDLSNKLGEPAARSVFAQMTFGRRDFGLGEQVEVSIGVLSIAFRLDIGGPAGTKKRTRVKGRYTRSA